MTYMPRLSVVPPQAPPQVNSRGSLLFTGALFATALLLQRFGVSAGSSYLNAVTPAGLGFATLFVLNGTVVFHRARVLIFALLCLFVFIGAAAGVLVPNALGGTPSPPSLVQFLLLTSFGVLTFSHAVEERAFFRVVNGCIAIVAIAGLIQFFIQFVHVELFSFKNFVPESVLVEKYWHVVIPVEGTPFFKSNGFFLLEPSLFSQYSALALLIEIVVLRRVLYVGLFGAALLLSVSGTGWLMILGFIVTAAVSLGGRGVTLAIITGGIGATALAVLALTSPDLYSFLIARTSEFAAPGSSAHLRFVTPWWFASDVLTESPRVFLFGLGAGVSEHPGELFPYEYNPNSIVKLLLEFGAPALMAFLCLFAANRRTRMQNALIAPIMVWLLWDGSNVEIPFVLLPSMMLLITADLVPATQVAR